MPAPSLLSITTSTKDGTVTKFTMSTAGDVCVDDQIVCTVDIARFLAAYASVLEIVSTTSPSQVRMAGSPSAQCHRVQIKLPHCQRRLCVYGHPGTDGNEYRDRNDREPRRVPQEIATLFGVCRENGWIY
ncbi:hypothetical protein ACHHYP_08228 [Achlya hypogyna]|uniref:Uncharacterized protein n=1 Tax=Achlya hypogyna TaxID=1202772 RepID=A0A1V9ZL68_ACHHY|nr:hypothetical protein ACHHYP_08228 [Achlya hypogyna]